MTTVLFSAGDASGDLHAAGLVRALRARRPDLRAIGLGGAAMEKAGVELVVHQRELAIGGLVEVLSSVRRVLGAWRRLGRALRTEHPALVVLVDSPDLNLPFARRARRQGVPILYYVSPQVWAWRRGRIRKIARRVDRMATIFPFEPAVYAGTGLRVEFVGHPLVEPLEHFAASHQPAELRARLGLERDAPLVALLPGSRRNELRHGLGLFLDVARALLARRPEVRFALGLAPTLSRAELDAALASLPGAPRVAVVEGDAHALIRAADVCLAKPGTVTVEIALLGTPLVVAGRANAITAAIARRVVSLPSFTMPNLIAGAPVVPEFLQEAARPDRIAEALDALLVGPAREAQLARLAAVRARLGAGGAAERAAAIADEMIHGAGRP